MLKANGELDCQKEGNGPDQLPEPLGVIDMYLHADSQNNARDL